MAPSPSPEAPVEEAKTLSLANVSEIDPALLAKLDALARTGETPAQTGIVALTLSKQIAPVYESVRAVLRAKYSDTSAAKCVMVFAKHMKHGKGWCLRNSATGAAANCALESHWARLTGEQVSYALKVARGSHKDRDVFGVPKTIVFEGVCTDFLALYTYIEHNVDKTTDTSKARWATGLCIAMLCQLQDARGRLLYPERELSEEKPANPKLVLSGQKRTPTQAKLAFFTRPAQGLPREPR